MTARRFLVFGRVQGVSFRYYTRLKATELDLVGFVRNRPDGSVETAAWGSEDALEHFRSFLHQGSHPARVDRVEEEDIGSVETPGSFEIRR